MRIILMGPQASGKGTQAKILSKELGVPHISTGDLLRDELARRTDIGVAIREILEAGRLVPDEIVLYMAEKRLSKHDCVKGFIADGFPRNLRQLQELDHVWRVDHAVHLMIDTQASIERLATRLNCPVCKSTYGPLNPPKVEGTCDRCGGDLKGRADDAARASVQKRLELYWREILPVIEYYRLNGAFRNVNGLLPLDDVANAVREAVGLG